MDNTNYHQRPINNIFSKIIVFLENQWPAIYRQLNNFLDGAWYFIKDTISGLWRQW